MSLRPRLRVLVPPSCVHRDTYMGYKYKQRKQKLQDLVNSIVEIDRQLLKNPTPELYAKLELKTEFDLLSTKNAEFVLRRTKATYYEYGDKAGRLLASQLKGLAASRLITQIYDSSGSSTKNPSDINDVFSLIIPTFINQNLLGMIPPWIIF